MIKVYPNRKVSETQITIGNQYESGVNAIDFDLSELKEKWPNGNIYLLVSRKKHTWPYSIDDGEFKIEYVLTWKRGFYQMNVVVTDEKITDQLESSNTIFVSDTINAYVNENQINAKALTEQELPRELQIVYDDLITLKKNIEKDLADGKYIGPQGPKGEKGDPGEKGEPGDVTEEYRNLASQIAQNATNAQASATNAQTSASNAQKILDDTKTFANQTISEVNQIKTDTNTLKEEANTSATNAKASETKAKEYADNLQASTDDISKLKEDLVANSKEDAKTKRSLSALWDLNNGISYRFETDSEKAYRKQIPSGAKLGSVNKVGGQIIKQDDALIVAGVNDVDVVGKNIFECEHFSCSGIKDGNSLDLSNDYGTSINSTAPSNRVTVTQSKIGQEDIITSYLNGYFCVAFKPFSLNKDYVFSLDVIPSNKLISNPKVIILMNGNDSINVEYAQDLQIGKRCKLYFNLRVNNKEIRYIEIRNSGISGIFENFQIEEGSINTSYAPHTKKSYPIPQSIQNLDGYGWSAGTAYNYVDFENKKYYKCVNKVDLGTLDYQNDNNVSFVSEGLKGYKLTNNYSTVPNIACKKYEAKSQNQMWGNKDVTGISVNALSDGYLYINDLSFSDAESFKNALQGVYLYYELAEPIVTDISDIIDDTFQEPFEVESGGSLTFKNTNGDGYRIAVPSDIQYTVALSEVNA